MLRCLIVDDSRHFQDAARRLLERQGVTVVGVVSTGAEAVGRIEELQPDVVLMDVNLGGESGFEVVRRLHRRSTGTPARVILISTHAEQDYADLVAASPAVGFLSRLPCPPALSATCSDPPARPPGITGRPNDRMTGVTGGPVTGCRGR
jgi:CheY-like chemotaxis protein